MRRRRLSYRQALAIARAMPTPAVVDATLRMVQGWLDGVDTGPTPSEVVGVVDAEYSRSMFDWTVWARVIDTLTTLSLHQNALRQNALAKRIRIKNKQARRARLNQVGCDT